MLESFGVINYTAYVIGVVFIILLPGPNSLYVLAVATQHGLRAGWRGAMGVFTGDLVLMVLTAAGAASIIQTYPASFFTLKYLGVVYLAFIGLRMIINVVKNWKKKSVEQIINASIEQTVANDSVYKKALLISLLNPKAIFFLLSFFVQFVAPDFAKPVIAFLILGLTLQFFSFLYLAGLIFLGHRIATHMKQHRHLADASLFTMGIVFIGFSIKLATASL